MEEKLDWLHSAESDYKALSELLFHNDTNAIGYISQQAIEKYVKHILVKASGISPLSVGNLTFYDKNSHKYKKFGHNIHVMLYELHNTYGIDTSKDLKGIIRQIENMYYQTRYPDVEDYHDITKEEICLCKNAVSQVRSWCYEKESQIDFNQEISIEE